jgi:hypothetical protein
MKGRKPTREERKTINDAGLDTWIWLVQKNTNDIMQVINKETGEEKIINKSK